MFKVSPIFESLIPPLSDKEFSQLEANIIKDGCRDPLVIWKCDGNEYVLIDGHNRFRICKEHNIDFDTVEYDFSDADEVKLWILKNQLGRRNLTDFQRAEIALQAEPLIAAKAKLNLVTSTGGINPQPLANLPNPEGVNTRDELSELSGISARNISKVKNIISTGSDELIETVRYGDISINVAEDIATLPKEEQKEIVARGEKEILEAAKEIRSKKAEAKRKENEELKAKTPPPVFSGQYDVLVLDPPWPMERIERDIAPNQCAFDYPTMSEDEIAAMQLPFSDKSHVFMWTTHKFLPMALRLYEKWGVKYVCAFVWHNNYDGTRFVSFDVRKFPENILIDSCENFFEDKSCQSYV